MDLVDNELKDELFRYGIETRALNSSKLVELLSLIRNSAVFNDKSTSAATKRNFEVDPLTDSNVQNERQLDKRRKLNDKVKQQLDEISSLMVINKKLLAKANNASDRNENFMGHENIEARNRRLLCDNSVWSSNKSIEEHQWRNYSLDTIEGKLLGDQLWKKFHKLGTEMIITKTGRRMFPALRAELSGMEESVHYCVCLEFVPASNCRFKYSSGTGWAPAGSEESHNFNYRYMHPDSPASGSHWMSQPISFGRVKLTNTVMPHAGQVVLSSMHKYQPRIIIVKTHDPARTSWINTKAIVFPETQFIAVTAYQNEEITRLKIDHNPFAKGFRENGQAKCKRKGHDRSSEEDTKPNEALEIDVEKLDSCDSIDFSEDQVSSSSSPSSRIPTSEERAPRPALTCYPNYYPLYNYLQHQYEYSYLNCDPRSYYFPSAFGYANPWGSTYGLHHAGGPGFPLNLPSHSKSQKPKKLTDFSIRAITGL